MISDPDFFLDEFVEAGSDSFLVHWEGNNNLHRTVQRIKGLGKRAGVAINPATPAAMLEEILPDLDQVLVMTVNPGFGHQHFLQSTLPKIRRVSQMIEQINPECALEVDGGIDKATAPLAVEAGANVLVAGTSIFGTNKKVADAMEALRDAITQVAHLVKRICNFQKRRIYATWNDRTGKNGRQYGATADQKRTRLRCVRPVAASSERFGQGERRRRIFSRGPCEKASEAASAMADGSSSSR